MIRYFRFTIVISSLLLAFTISSCEKQAKKSDLSQKQLDSLQVTLKQIEYSLDTIWKNMIEDDNQKIADAKRLLEEISYTNIYSPAQHDSLMQTLVELQKLRYDEISMQNSNLIDEYDSLSNKVMNDIILLATSHSDFERYPLMKVLIKDIREANGRVLKHRINYDFAAKSYNQFIEENKEKLIEEDSTKNSTKQLNKKPLFELAS